MYYENIPYFKQKGEWDDFYPDEIIYVPEYNICSKEYVFTKQDLINECDGDELKAELLFYRLEWQCPNTELESWDEEDEAELEQIRKERGHDA